MTPAPTTTSAAPSGAPAGDRAPRRGGFASATVPRHLARGAIGFGALIGSLVLLRVVGPAGLLLAPLGLVALRGCPMCWAVGLVETVSAGRLRRSCAGGSCTPRRV
ncbi:MULTISPECIES: hypothetical protein [unclassified Streptomyces]|uniref:hypothetical protein n=1 Tax=unclassified Streptomyces TaxID=2593676 RepID=UPI0006C6A8BA|nr:MULTISPECIES: hypothetical protein [unclassified Streptomyces]KOX16260.1 hypothetical protein ADL06_33775 [Streptomyces sp. NRRL F-6491]KOX36195.1 hypothetical protein ADL08_33095 [Streptomyces sp. NRRL F-6492]